MQLHEDNVYTSWLVYIVSLRFIETKLVTLSIRKLMAIGRVIIILSRHN